MHLTRNTQEKCVMARVMRKGRRHQRNFTIKRFKTWTAAETAAARWVRAKLKVLPASESNARDRMTVRNHSGIVGVHKSKHVVHTPYGQEHEYWRWSAHWPGCKNSGGVSWYISRFGDDDAFVLAALTRRIESINRPEIVARLEAIKGKKEYKDILALKNQ
jgi:hypothetical protein